MDQNLYRFILFATFLIMVPKFFFTFDSNVKNMKVKVKSIVLENQTRGFVVIFSVFEELEDEIFALKIMIASDTHELCQLNSVES